MKKTMTRDELLNVRLVQQAEGTEFYRIPALNYTGVCTDSAPYGEVIAEWLYDNFEREDDLKRFLLNGSDMKEEKEFPAGPIHSKEDIKYSEGSNRNEENIAKRLLQMEHLEIFGHQGLTLLDYQVPINRVLHSGEGKADLVFFDGKNIVIGELKDEDSQETLLRAVVEAKTYQYKIQSCESSLKRYAACYSDNPKELPKWIQPAVLIFDGKDSQPWKDFDAMMSMEKSWLKSLISKWDMEIFAVGTEGDMAGKPYAERNYLLKRVL